MLQWACWQRCVWKRSEYSSKMVNTLSRAWNTLSMWVMFSGALSFTSHSFVWKTWFKTKQLFNPTKKILWHCEKQNHPSCKNPFNAWNNLHVSVEIIFANSCGWLDTNVCCGQLPGRACWRPRRFEFCHIRGESLGQLPGAHAKQAPFRVREYLTRNWADSGVTAT